MNNNKKITTKAKVLLGFLLLLNIFNMLDRTLITAFAPQIMSDLSISDTQYGLLNGLIFVFFYVISGVFMGVLADRLHRPRLIAAGLFLWSALTAYSGAAKNFAQIAVARLFIGVGESTMTPTSMSMISDLFPQRFRGTAAGLYYLGVPVGASLAFILAGIFGPTYGWRMCFYALGFLGVLLSLILLFIKDPQRGGMDDSDQNLDLPSSTGNKRPWRQVLSDVTSLLKSSPVLLWTLVGSILLHVPIGAATFALPWMISERGFELSEIQQLYGYLYLLFGTLGTLLGGILSDWYQSRYSGGRLRFLAIVMILIAPLTIAYRFAPADSWLFLVGFSVVFFSASAFYGPAFSTFQDLTPPQLRGVMTAVLLLACNLFGASLGAGLGGVLIDAMRDGLVVNPYTTALFVFDIIGFLAAPSMLLASFFFERQKKSIARIG